MNRNRAKLLTATGVFFVLAAIGLIVVHLVGQSNFPVVVAPALFVGGIVLVVLSLAYYTDK